MRYLRFIITIMITSFVIFEGIVFGIICVPQNVFETSYNSLIQDKFDILMRTNEPKIIMVSGSSSAFGLNQSMLQEASGYEVVNMGLHAGFGHLFSSELAKANINEGDIVLLGYEYGWQADTGFIRSGADVIMSGIDDNVRMYKYLPPTIWRNCLGYLFTFASRKNDYPTKTGIYSREAFDHLTGQMTMARTSNME